MNTKSGPQVGGQLRRRLLRLLNPIQVFRDRTFACWIILTDALESLHKSAISSYCLRHKADSGLAMHLRLAALLNLNLLPVRFRVNVYFVGLIAYFTQRTHDIEYIIPLMRLPIGRKLQLYNQ